MRAVSLISTGIDSPVSSYLMMKKCDLTFLHFDRGNTDILMEILRTLKPQKSAKLTLVVADHDELMSRLKEVDFPEKQTCVYCKASMLLFAERVCMDFGCDIIITGDSLGQVASQTLLNMKSEESLVSLPVIRPLIGLDKVEIVEIARRIGTYELSVKSNDTCPYAPKHPVTRGCEIKEDVKNVVHSTEYRVLKV